MTKTVITHDSEVQTRKDINIASKILDVSLLPLLSRFSAKTDATPSSISPWPLLHTTPPRRCSDLRWRDSSWRPLPRVRSRLVDEFRCVITPFPATAALSTVDRTPNHRVEPSRSFCSIAFCSTLPTEVFSRHFYFLCAIHRSQVLQIIRPFYVSIKFWSCSFGIGRGRCAPVWGVSSSTWLDASHPWQNNMSDASLVVLRSYPRILVFAFDRCIFTLTCIFASLCVLKINSWSLLRPYLFGLFSCW